MEGYRENSYESKPQNNGFEVMMYAVEAASLIFASPMHLTGKIFEMMIKMSAEDSK